MSDKNKDTQQSNATIKSVRFVPKPISETSYQNSAISSKSGNENAFTKSDFMEALEKVVKPVSGDDE